MTKLIIQQPVTQWGSHYNSPWWDCIKDSLLYQKLRLLKNDFQCEYRHKIIILFQSGLEINLFTELGHFKCITFRLCLSSVADFSNTGARAPTSAECAPFYPFEGCCGLDIWFGWES